MKISDGKTVWVYQVNERRYTAKPLPVAASAQTPRAFFEMAMMRADNLRAEFGQMTKSLKSAERLPDATLLWNGREISCYVVRVRSTDEKRTQANYTFDKDIWIDKAADSILKTVEHSHTGPTGGFEASDMETTTTFPAVELDGQVRDGLFTFTPPSDARLVQEFPNPMRESMGTTLTGQQIPSLQFKSSDGKAASIESFRGKPVLLDNWATWCSPCVAALPELARIYQDGKDKGLTLISVDRDEDAGTAAEFLSKKGYAWPNYHDGSGEIEKLIGPSGIPRVLLIDASGKVVFDTMISTEDQLRAEIAKLGPDLASLAPKPEVAPCIASK
jgi:thiol-disulfide isomerase/thioredoxin